MADSKSLPPGQFEVSEFPRFGLGRFARRFPANSTIIEFDVRGDIEQPITVKQELLNLPRIEQISDFHCVTTWSYRSLRWSGFRFADFYQSIVVPLARPLGNAGLVVFRGQDGYASSLPLSDLMAPEVMLADQLNGEGLGIEHGAPLRLVAPAHYGYKNVKHIGAIEFWRDSREYRFPPPYPALMDHPRARVALEERGVGVPAWILRYVYRALIRPTIRNFRRSLDEYLSKPGSGS